ncbi:hypothetical protein SLS57_009562 [Botryosphaeria dothidea]
MSLVEFTRFMNDAAALEKTLRLLQGIAQLSVSIFATVETEEAAHLVDVSGTLRKHFALGRRYFRVFKWIDCALIAADALRNNEALVDSEREGVLALLNIAKWSYLGMFLFTEAFTIVDALGVRKFSWAPMLFVESMRFWFYSISCSIILTCYDLHMNRNEIIRLQAEIAAAKEAAGTTENGDGATRTRKEKRSKEEIKDTAAPEQKKNRLLDDKQALEKARVRRHALLRQLIGASCDLLTPGAVVNYTPVSPAAVAITSIISSLISSQDIWKKVNKK